MGPLQAIQPHVLHTSSKSQFGRAASSSNRVGEINVPGYKGPERRFWSRKNEPLARNVLGESVVRELFEGFDIFAGKNPRQITLYGVLERLRLYAADQNRPLSLRLQALDKLEGLVGNGSFSNISRDVFTRVSKVSKETL